MTEAHCTAEAAGSAVGTPVECDADDPTQVLGVTEEREPEDAGTPIVLVPESPPEVMAATGITPLAGWLLGVAVLATVIGIWLIRRSGL